MATPKKRKISSAKENLPSQKVVDVNYVKTGSYRTYHVDGMFGGPTAHGKIYIELFIERAVTPQVIQFEVTQEGTLGKEVSRTGKKGIVREIEAGLIMDVAAAKSFGNWLNEKVKQWGKIQLGEKKKGEK